MTDRDGTTGLKELPPGPVVAPGGLPPVAAIAPAPSDGVLRGLWQSWMRSPVRPWVLPVFMTIALVVGLLLTIGRVIELVGWHDQYDGRGQFQVFGCESELRLGADQWSCQGALVPDDSTIDVASELVTSAGARSSRQPFVGQWLDVFYQSDDLNRVHPLEFLLNELLRLYLSLLPRVLLVGGSILWLTGWFATRGVDRNDLLARDDMRFPNRFAWKARAWRWLVAAGILVIVNQQLAMRLIGSLDTF